MKNLKLLAFFVLLSGTQLNAMNNEASAVVKTMADRTEDGSSSQSRSGMPGFTQWLDSYIEQKGWEKPAAQLEPMTQEELVEFNNQLVSFLRDKWLSLEYQILWQVVQVYREQYSASIRDPEGYYTPQPITALDELPDILAGITSNLLVLAAFMDTNYDEIEQLIRKLRHSIDNSDMFLLDRILSDFSLEYFSVLEFLIGQIKSEQALYEQFVRFVKQKVVLNKGLTEHLFLHRAAWHGYADTAQMLIDAGAAVNTRDIYGNTPLDEAKEASRKPYVAHKNYKQIIKLLEQAQLEEEHRARTSIALLSEAPVASTSLHNVPNTANSIFGKPFGSDHA